jgi:hypothetical protein
MKRESDIAIQSPATFMITTAGLLWVLDSGLAVIVQGAAAL